MAESGFRDLRNGVNALDETGRIVLRSIFITYSRGARQHIGQIRRLLRTTIAWRPTTWLTTVLGLLSNCFKSLRKACEDLKRTCETTSAFFCKRFSSMRKDCPLKCGVCKEGEEMPTNIP
ncbi:hypothetical protein AC249_AIPGENE1237 [Exaiptasia diaphana]|nr:hypothetical protein AC249_AIPGENE1237 [Exaiptasia diaphana]